MLTVTIYMWEYLIDLMKKSLSDVVMIKSFRRDCILLFYYSMFHNMDGTTTVVYDGKYLTKNTSVISAPHAKKIGRILWRDG